MSLACPGQMVEQRLCFPAPGAVWRRGWSTRWIEVGGDHGAGIDDGVAVSLARSRWLASIQTAGRLKADRSSRPTAPETGQG